MLTKAGVAVLDALSADRAATPAELARETNYSQPHLYDIVEELLSEGLVIETRGAHNQRRIRATDHPVVEAYRNLRVKLGHVD